MPGAAGTLSLAQYRLGSRWRSLAWFWLSILAATAALGLVLEILGPPPGRMAAAQPAPEAVQPVPFAKPVQAASRPAEPERLAAPAPARRPEPDQLAPPPPTLAADPQLDAPTPARATLVLHPARPGVGATIASRLGTQTGLAPEQVDVGSVVEGRSEAVIRFYVVGDHPLARRIAKELGRMGYPWRIENFATRTWAWKDQAIEVFLPDK